ncbi:MAG: hypothetical protein HKL82_05575 [Acidimicrobiaceae bacterium]|nr:hypothetical protein [Acidimicrobiaceae bacterium]
METSGIRNEKRPAVATLNSPAAIFPVVIANEIPLCRRSKPKACGHHCELPKSPNSGLKFGASASVWAIAISQTVKVAAVAPRADLASPMDHAC